MEFFGNNNTSFWKKLQYPELRTIRLDLGSLFSVNTPIERIMSSEGMKADVIWCRLVRRIHNQLHKMKRYESMVQNWNGRIFKGWMQSGDKIKEIPRCNYALHSGTKTQSFPAKTMASTSSWRLDVEYVAISSVNEMFLNFNCASLPIMLQVLRRI